MKRVLLVLLMATIGSAIGSVIRQKVSSQSEELVIAASPVPIAVGTVAGLISPKGKPLTALIVSANVSANLKT